MVRRRTPARTRHATPLRRAIGGGLVAALSFGTLGTAVGLAPSAAAGVPDDELVLRYDFEPSQVSGDVIEDLSAKGLDGKLVNAGNATFPQGHTDGSAALELPGGATGSTTAPYVQIPNGVFEGLEAATISTWVRWDGGADFQWVYNLGRDNNRATFLTPSFGGDPRSRSSIKPVNNNAEVGVSSIGKLPTGTWVNAVTVIDQSTITYYLNGIRVGSTNATLDLDAVMHSPTNTTSGFLGKPFWGGHPFFDGALDDFRIYGTALGAETVAELYGQALPTLQGVAQTSISVETTRGTAPALPATAPGDFSDRIQRAVNITWDEVEPSSYAEPGRFSVNGTVDGTDQVVTANVRVTLPGQTTIDLGESTGAFHGGASGTLYGLYDQGLPSNNLVDAINLRTVATKAQDGPQHPGADALEVVKPLADSSDGDVYIYMTDVHRGFPYQWPGSTPEQKLDLYMEKLEKQVDQVLELPAEYQDNIVLMPYNEPEGNMFGTGEWSYNRVSWLNNPTDFFAAWDRAYHLIKTKWPEARIGGPNTSVLFNQVHGFMEHVVEAGTVPDVIAWHELSDPATIRSSVDRYRGWEDEIFAGTDLEGTHLPINITEYAFNYHTSVPGQMIQWVSALEDKKVFGDIAYWNIDGNLSDSAVQANRANGQWWLLNAYAQMSGNTVKLTPPRPNVSYTLQGVATLDQDKAQARTILGGAGGESFVSYENVPTELFGQTVHVQVKEIGWTGQLGDSANPPTVAEYDAQVSNGGLVVHFGGEDVPAMNAESAYQIILTPGANASASSTSPTIWDATYEAEDAAHTGSGWSLNGPEGGPTRQGSFYTSGEYNVGGLRTGSNVTLDFTVDVPQDGTYDLSVFANSLNTYGAVQEQGPTNVFLRVDGDATTEQEIHLPLGYKWVVWDHADTTVDLTAGKHTITLAARSLDGTRVTKGDAIVDKIDLSLANPKHTQEIYEAEYASLDGAQLDYSIPGVSGSGVASIGADQAVTFWVYSPTDAGAHLTVDATGDGQRALSVNDREITTQDEVTTFLVGGINKITVQGTAGTTLVDRLRVEFDDESLSGTTYEAEDGELAGTAQVSGLTLASGGKAVTNVGGDPGNANTLTFDNVEAPAAGTYAMTVRYSNQEQSPATHYNPDPLARYAHISVNGGEVQKVPFPHSFHQNNFWDLTVFVDLDEGSNTIRFSSEEKPNFDGVTYASDDWPDVLLRSKYAPNLDKITITPTTTVEADELDVSVEATPRCLAGRAYLAIRATNNENGPVDITVTTPVGSKTFTAVAPGTAAYQSFNSRATTLSAGSGTWEVTREDRSATLTADYQGTQCG
ncbi:Ig-like domain-containing protein [Cellulosimicrobium cellulans]|uniref:LamG-like jellyroll fold domain-containing protein n=1 Tax=Cellulosimicrobium cellulans TaxID=1710 RepID=UPI001962B663|nr:LamG-like jellyroll fold domain-containing protein [Cellulosimicrobium cellulans]MBN0038594.1 Ig-like domain-containing protein [Cellulosimicrobium cellulans]